jgi:hypothetical protein
MIDPVDAEADNPKSAPRKSTSDAKDQGFDEELRADVGARGAHGHSDSYFADTIGYRAQHHIHDADTGDRQCQRCNSRKQKVEGAPTVSIVKTDPMPIMMPSMVKLN